MDSDRTCWVCFGTDKDTASEWISPCRCSGSTKWVHQVCLRRWINEGNGQDVSSCPQCKTPYTIEEPKIGSLIAVGDVINRIVNQLAPVACGLLTFASAWAGLSVYGAVTFAHVCGREGRAILRAADPLRLFLVMPVIPFVLILVRIRVAVRVRVVATTQPAAATPVPEPAAARRNSESDRETDSDDDDEVHVAEPTIPQQTDQFDLQLPDIQSPISFSRLVAGGLLLPYVASAVGRLCFRGNAVHPLDRTLLGGVVYLVIKGIAKHWYRIQKNASLGQRRILNFAP